MVSGNGRSSLWRISQVMASMSSPSLGFLSSGDGAAPSNRISYSRYGPVKLEQATAASIAGSSATIRQRLLTASALAELPLLQHATKNLARGRLRNGVDELDLARNLVVGEAALDEGDDVARREIVARLA